MNILKSKLCREMGISSEKTIPRSFLKKITYSRPGMKLKNPLFQGKYQMKVDSLVIADAKRLLNTKK